MLQLPSHKHLTRDVAISRMPAPDELVLPLNQNRRQQQGQHGHELLQACVTPGDAVMMGQIIARSSQPLDAVLHAPVSGTVLAIEARATAKPLSEAAPCIVLRNDHRESLHPDCQPLPHWPTTDGRTLREHLALGGIVGLGGAAFPTALKYATAQNQPVEYLLVNGVECEPYLTCDDRLMREQAAAIISGVRIALHATGARQALIGVEDDKPEAMAALQLALQNNSSTNAADVIELRSVPHVYPAGDEAQLAKFLCGKEVPRGGLPTDLGIVVSNVATLHACQQWIMHGRPLLSRVVTVTGRGVVHPGNYEVRQGTSLTQLLQHCGGIAPQERAASPRFILGGAMMGQSLPHTEFPVIKSTHCLIVASADELPMRAAEQPCIRCGECAEVCPVNLLPQQLLAQSRQHHTVALQQLGLMDCIECGCCDHVCPSNLRLASRFSAAKQWMVKQ